MSSLSIKPWLVGSWLDHLPAWPLSSYQHVTKHIADEPYLWQNVATLLSHVRISIIQNVVCNSQLVTNLKDSTHLIECQRWKLSCSCHSKAGRKVPGGTWSKVLDWLLGSVTARVTWLSHRPALPELRLWDDAPYGSATAPDVCHWFLSIWRLALETMRS